MTQAQPAQVIVIYGDGSSYQHHIPQPQVAHTEQMSAPKAVSEKKSAPTSVLNPHDIQRDFPQRWKAYIRANYRNLKHIEDVFGVSERCARKWWNGEGGAGGAYVSIAVNQHPIAAPNMLFAAE